MRGLAPPALLTIGIAASLLGCGATDPDAAGDTAQRFYGAAHAKDGAKACEQLGEDTRAQLEQDEGGPCAEAVLELRLSGERATGVSAYMTEAKVDLDGGDSVFLEQTADGWRVTAAGCRPVPDQEAPYECEVES
jgi:hypothetical protein